MELAYALTIHKAQGSQFGLTIVVLPEGIRSFLGL
jgi:ATP-dependent exoDNAse (exonuclease V) alpha subunit